MSNWTTRDGTVHIDSHNRHKGNAAARRARKHWLLSPESGWGGDGQRVRCWECGVWVTFETVISDRIVPGCRGGRYVGTGKHRSDPENNIRPHCQRCSLRQSDTLWRQYGCRSDRRHTNRKAS